MCHNVGPNTAIDKYVQFEILDNILVWNDETSLINNKRVQIQIGGDEPTINALYILKGNIEDAPHEKERVTYKYHAAMPDLIPTIFAINVGGYKHVDFYGIKYDEDPLNGVDGMGNVTNHETSITVKEILNADKIFHITERSSNKCFGYEIPLPHKSSKYILVIKFWVNTLSESKQKKFNIFMNSNHTVLKNVVISNLVGKNVAYDMHVPFHVEKNIFHYLNEESSIWNNSVRIELCGVSESEAFLNAFYVMQGNVQDLPIIKYKSIHKLYVVFAMNIGGIEYTSNYGITYKTDSHFINVNENEFIFLEWQDPEGVALNDDELYLFSTIRYNLNGSISYEIPI